MIDLCPWGVISCLIFYQPALEPGLALNPFNKRINSLLQNMLSINKSIYTSSSTTSLYLLFRFPIWAVVLITRIIWALVSIILINFLVQSLNIDIFLSTRYQDICLLVCYGFSCLKVFFIECLYIFLSFFCSFLYLYPKRSFKAKQDTPWYHETNSFSFFYHKLVPGIDPVSFLW